ncbi:hypothetical protein C0995_011183, partial [Termitomyces sp. Mi166
MAWLTTINAGLASNKAKTPATTVDSFTSSFSSFLHSNLFAAHAKDPLEKAELGSSAHVDVAITKMPAMMAIILTPSLTPTFKDDC